VACGARQSGTGQLHFRLCGGPGRRGGRWARAAWAACPACRARDLRAALELLAAAGWIVTIGAGTVSSCCRYLWLRAHRCRSCRWQAYLSVTHTASMQITATCITCRRARSTAFAARLPGSWCTPIVAKEGAGGPRVHSSRANARHQCAGSELLCNQLKGRPLDGRHGDAAAGEVEERGRYVGFCEQVEWRQLSLDHLPHHIDGTH